MTLVAINASHSAGSSTHHVAELAVELHGTGRVIDLVGLDPGALIGVGSTPDVVAALEAVAAADIVVAVTPIYRATYSGLLKVLFDQLPQDALAGTAVVAAATAASPAHFLALDTGVRALVASLGGWTVPHVTYATPTDFDEAKRPSDAVRTSLRTALDQAAVLVAGLTAVATR